MSVSEVADLRQKVKDYEKQVSEFEGELALMVKMNIDACLHCISADDLIGFQSIFDKYLSSSVAVLKKELRERAVWSLVKVGGRVTERQC